MAITEDELIAISELPSGAVANSAIQPDLITLHELRGSIEQVVSLPYQHTLVDVFGGNDSGLWSQSFQNPLQRVVLDLEIFFDTAVENVPPNLSALTLTLSGFSAGSIFTPATTASAAAPVNFFGLNIAGISPKIKLGGRRRRLEQSGQVIIPLTAILLSTTPLTSQEQNRVLSVKLERTDKSQQTIIPIISGMVYANPLPSQRDITLVG
ncbi:hypothetical protein [Yersinia pekkanenii]|uniref:Uncharacterized protein n=1 Tax=Yersinia pekkanenii TaxID=1288385 RepID=A0A0T9PAU0_9GAMM|nr:hypothetical protein [Yersinia pekkanenii]CNH53461.1 Uncharacterised protein [Yersinia pekkanenii]CRY67552.1 Uncharacterised protein [Yersinia pekkanenii]